MARSNAGFMKALMGIALIVMIVLVINNLSKKADLQDFDKYKAKLNNYKNLTPFSEPQKDSVSKELAGFWQYDRPAKDTSPAISDRIEIKDNGIIWRVITYKYPTSGSDTSIFTKASTSYLRPFASNKDNPSFLTFDLHIIRQTFAGKDTCYSNLNPDTTWEITRTAGGLQTGNMIYTPFDTSDLKHFFPDGAVAMVDAVTVDPCSNAFLTSNYRDQAIQQPSTSLPDQKETP
jgi:hypothetical protein